MSSKSNNRLWNRVAVRIGSGYLLLFGLGVTLIFAANYFYLVHSLRAHDYELIDESFDHYSLVYRTAGLDGLKREIATENSPVVLNQLLLRVQNPKTGQIVFYHAPKDINEFDSKTLDETLNKAGVSEAVIQIPSRNKNQDELEIMQGKTTDGLIIQVGKNTEDREDFLDRFRDSFLVISFACLLIGILGAVVFVSRLLRPMRDLIRALKTIENGDRDVRANEGLGQDELSELSRLFNRIWSKNQRLVSEMRQSLDMVAHDLRTPLTRVRGYAEEGLRSQSLAEKDSAFSDCISNIDETTTLLDLMLEIAESEAGAKRLHKVSLNCLDLIVSIKDLYSLVAEDKQISIMANCDQGLTIIADKRFKQALANLVDNAIKYSREHATVKIAAKSLDSVVIFEVSDEGPGIIEADREKIWTRFYRGTVSNWQPGLGLGLSLVASIVHAHDGTVEIANSDRAGSTFRIILPRLTFTVEDK